MNDILNDRYEGNRSLSLAACDQYEREVRWVESLSFEDEKKFLDRLLRARRDPSNARLRMLAKDARERLAEHYQPFVHRIAVGYSRRLPGMDFLDIVQEANIALLQAFDTFPFDLRKTFEDWASSCICIRLRGLFQGGRHFFRLSPRILKGISDITRLEQRYAEEFGRPPRLEELVDALGLSLSRVCELLAYRRLQSVDSVEALCGRLEVSEDYFSFQEVYRSASEGELTRSEKLAVRIEEMLSKLPSRSQQVVKLRYGLCGEPSCMPEEIATCLGLDHRKVNDALTYARVRLRVLFAPLSGDLGEVA